ncbi:hypothetical protein AB1K62_08325 [Parasphingorhabdus sp. JC815]|uniref:hypothetical protein n=1 Tax=Parasphingorhabdus sp. JC815 TaxID=3232140 RepID=UPI0034575B6F
MFRFFILFLIAAISAPLMAAEQEPDGAQILAMAREAAGGDDWANATTLTLSGHAVFYGAQGHEPKSMADDYRMWREYDLDRTSAHGADGKVRIIAKSGEKTLFEVGYDGETTWTQNGIMPKEKADKYWANNFGFGIIRHADKPGFSATRLADDLFDGHKIYVVELKDPQGSRTLFGIDQESHAIRTLGFDTPRGWHRRTYRDFVTLKNPRWLQARHVTLYYDDRKSNEVFWTKTKVNAPIDNEIFAPPEK